MRTKHLHLACTLPSTPTTHTHTASPQTMASSVRFLSQRLPRCSSCCSYKPVSAPWLQLQHTQRWLCTSATAPQQQQQPPSPPDDYLEHASSHLHTPSAAHKQLVDEILRVDQAGETGAVRIYEGQLAVLRSPPDRTIAHMKEQEVRHLEDVNKLVAQRRVRPSAILPFWEAAGFALGAGTALLGREAAMACTVAVEEVIGEHYNDQIRSLLEGGYREEELLALLKKNRDEELEHLDTGLEQGAEQAPFYDAMSNVIKVGCRAAIWVAKRV